MHAWKIKQSPYLQYKTKGGNYRLIGKWDGRRPALPATAAHFEERLQSCFEQTCPCNINHTKRFLKTTIKRQSCIPIAWQCPGGEGLAGTPKQSTLNFWQDKRAFGLAALQRISRLLARKNVKCSLTLFSQSKPSYHRVCNRKKRKR